MLNNANMLRCCWNFYAIPWRLQLFKPTLCQKPASTWQSAVGVGCQGKEMEGSTWNSLVRRVTIVLQHNTSWEKCSSYASSDFFRHFYVWSIVHLTQNDILANKLAFSSSWWFRVFLGPSGPRLDEGWWKQTKRRRQTREIDAGEICLTASEKSGLRFKGLGAVMSHRTKQYNMTTSGPIQPFGRLRGDLPSLVPREVSPVACSFSQKTAKQKREEADVLKASKESLQMQRKSSSVYLAMYSKLCNLLAGHRQNWVPLLDPDECTIQMLRWVPKFMIWPTWDKSHTITIIHNLDCKLI